MVLTTFLIMELRVLEIISVSVGVAVSAVDKGDSRVWVRLGVVGAGVGAK